MSIMIDYFDLGLFFDAPKHWAVLKHARVQDTTVT